MLVVDRRYNLCDFDNELCISSFGELKVQIQSPFNESKIVFFQSVVFNYIT